MLANHAQFQMRPSSPGSPVTHSLSKNLNVQEARA